MYKLFSKFSVRIYTVRYGPYVFNHQIIIYFTTGGIEDAVCRGRILGRNRDKSLKSFPP